MTHDTKMAVLETGSMNRLLVMMMAIAVAMTVMAPAIASTVVPGHADRDGTVNGKYTSVYAWDSNGDYYWDLGDGRVYGVGSIADLDEETLTVCDYQVQYRGDFGGDPFLDDGWIMNNITCSGYEYDGGTQTFIFLIVHETDPRYTGNEDLAIWGEWEYATYVVGGEGNLAKGAEALVG